MFENLDANEDFKSEGPWSDTELQNARKLLGQLAPDFLTFVEKFGSAEIGEGFFFFYSGIADLDDHLIGMGLEKMGLNAWVFGAGDGDLGIIDKKTGEFFQLCHETNTILSPTYNSFNNFLFNWLLRE